MERIATDSLGQDAVIRVLLVEDNPGDARLTREYLCEDPSFRVDFVWAETLADGIALVTKDVNQVALLDLSLPDSSGFDTFVRFYEHAAHLPIIVLSGHEDEHLAQQIVHHGGQDSLPKELISGPLMRRTIRHAIERKQILEELRLMQMQLIQAEKMESIGRLAAGVAHEVKNPLARIVMGIDYLSTDLDPNDPNIPVVLSRMEDAVRRAETIVSDLLNYASDRQLGMTDEAPNDLIESALRLVDHELKARKVEVTRRLSADLPLVRVDKGKMDQALINLLLNALQAMDSGAQGFHLNISTKVAVLEDIERNEGARTRDHLRRGDQVVIFEIEDTGSGISPVHLSKLYDPFFTTKPTGVGTGLGLSVVRKIIDLHKGQITLENRDPVGVRARIVLKAIC